VVLVDLRTQLVTLDSDISALRDTINPPTSPLREVDSTGRASPAAMSVTSTTYDGIDDAAKLGRLVKAKEKTKLLLESKAGWAAMAQSNAMDEAARAAQIPAA